MKNRRPKYNQPRLPFRQDPAAPRTTRKIPERPTALSQLAPETGVTKAVGQSKTRPSEKKLVVAALTIPWQTLFEPVITGARTGWRISMFEHFAAECTRLQLSEVEADALVIRVVKWVIERTGGSKGTEYNLICDGRLAAHSEVRSRFLDVLAVAQEVVATQPHLIKNTVRKSYHGIVELMKLVRDPSTRHHAASAPAFILYLQTEYPKKHRKTGPADGLFPSRTSTKPHI